VNLDDVREILALMRENGLSEFEIEREGLKLRLRNGPRKPRKQTAGRLACRQAIVKRLRSLP